MSLVTKLEPSRQPIRGLFLNIVKNGLASSSDTVRPQEGSRLLHGHPARPLGTPASLPVPLDRWSGVPATRWPAPTWLRQIALCDLGHGGERRRTAEGNLGTRLQIDRSARSGPASAWAGRRANGPDGPGGSRGSQGPRRVAREQPWGLLGPQCVAGGRQTIFDYI